MQINQARGSTRAQFTDFCKLIDVDLLVDAAALKGKDAESQLVWQLHEHCSQQAQAGDGDTARRNGRGWTNARARAEARAAGRGGGGKSAEGTAKAEEASDQVQEGGNEDQW